MTTIRQIITDAYREGGLIQIGTTPEAEQLDEGVRKLQSIVTQLLGNEMGEGFETVAYGTDAASNSFAKDYDKKVYLDSYYVPSNVRLLVNTNSSQTIYLDPNPSAGARVAVVDVAGTFGTSNFTINANGRKIDGSTSLVLNTNGDNGQWFYRDDLAQWVKVTNIGPDSQSPYPPEFDELLSTTLAIRLNPRYQQQTSPETIQAMRQAKSQFRSRYRQAKFTPSDISLLLRHGFITRLSYTNPTILFNRGLTVG